MYNSLGVVPFFGLQSCIGTISEKTYQNWRWTFATRLDFVDSDEFHSGCSAETLQPTFIK